MLREQLHHDSGALPVEISRELPEKQLEGEDQDGEIHAVSLHELAQLLVEGENEADDEYVEATHVDHHGHHANRPRIQNVSVKDDLKDKEYVEDQLETAPTCNENQEPRSGQKSSRVFHRCHTELKFSSRVDQDDGVTHRVEVPPSCTRDLGDN